MNQRGSIAVYLLFSIAISVAAGYGVYRFMRDHKDAFTSNNDEDAATTKQATAPTVKPSAAPAPEPVAAVPAAPAEEEPAVDPLSEALTLAESRAVEPVLDESSGESPVMGTPGTSGGIERGSVERRFRSRAPLLQRCWERSDSAPASLRVVMQVEPDGKVARITLRSGGDDGFQACVISALNFTFSATKDHNPAVVVQPIAFR